MGFTSFCRVFSAFTSLLFGITRFLFQKWRNLLKSLETIKSTGLIFQEMVDIKKNHLNLSQRHRRGCSRACVGLPWRLWRIRVPPPSLIRSCWPQAHDRGMFTPALATDADRFDWQWVPLVRTRRVEKLLFGVSSLGLGECVLLNVCQVKRGRLFLSRSLLV